ncbi:nucleotidyltransferase AbiEii toxin of type IV toxin-antitoxin system [Spirosoma oryzae]|uniref:Nucleotidyltransferase AbiEii toxin of type IV toxin-antitoxin system n=2 Tax=Spirosoma oryzae TaxID=1469603 RepID=A0A2T0RKT5_9BACT|nr:nucleotidyltransferase AbiEii toxin of type IV toxin-antitoxin system [Spirosoma oryzae]
MQSPLVIDEIRLATVEEIVAMKVDVVQRVGRKKDFWDLHEVLPNYSIEQMLALHNKRYEYTHERELVLKNFTDFTKADDDFDPNCLRGKHWAFVKEDISDAVRSGISSDNNP